MISLQRTVTTPADAAAVWEYLADFTHAEQWDPNAAEVVRIAGDGAVGSQYRVTSRFAGRTTELDYRLTDLTAPGPDATAVIRLRGEKPSITAVDTITVIPATDGGTEVTYAVDFDFHGVFGLLEPLLRRSVNRLLDEGARGLESALSALA